MSFLIALFFDIWIGVFAAAMHTPLSDTALTCMAIVLAGGLAGLGDVK